MESLSAEVLYSNEKIVDLRELKIQIHFHEDKDGKITGSKLKNYKDNKIRDLSNYEAAMGDAYADSSNIPRIDPGSKY